MNVTPTPQMFEAMSKFVEALCGPEPSKIEQGPGADRVRARRRFAFDVLHSLVGLSMKEGVKRAVEEARVRRDGYKPIDVEDRSAAAKARDDAAEGKPLIQLPH